MVNDVSIKWSSDQQDKFWLLCFPMIGWLDKWIDEQVNMSSSSSIKVVDIACIHLNYRNNVMNAMEKCFQLFYTCLLFYDTQSLYRTSIKAVEARFEMLCQCFLDTKCFIPLTQCIVYIKMLISLQHLFRCSSNTPRHEGTKCWINK